MTYDPYRFAVLYTEVSGESWKWAPVLNNRWDDVVTRGTVNVTPSDADREPQYIVPRSLALIEFKDKVYL